MKEIEYSKAIELINIFKLNYKNTSYFDYVSNQNYEFNSNKLLNKFNSNNFKYLYFEYNNLFKYLLVFNLKYTNIYVFNINPNLNFDINAISAKYYYNLSKYVSVEYYDLYEPNSKEWLKHQLKRKEFKIYLFL